MNHSLLGRRIRLSAARRCLAGCVVIFASMAWGQGRSAESEDLWLRDIDGSSVRSPKYGVSSVSRISSNRREWFRIRGEYETAPKWTDNISFTCYALFKPDPRHSGIDNPATPYLIISGEVAHANVKKGDHIVDMYIHPSTLERFGKVEHFAVVAKQSGRQVGWLSQRDVQDGWWTQLKAVEGQILSRDQTPFSLTNIDAYEMIPPAAASSIRR
jgi:hypothetical protein